MSQIIQKIWKIGSIKNLLNKKMILFINKIKRAKMWIMRMFNKLIKLIKKIENYPPNFGQSGSIQESLAPLPIVLNKLSGYSSISCSNQLLYYSDQVFSIFVFFLMVCNLSLKLFWF